MEEEDCVVRLRGLPWSTQPEEIVKFLEGCMVAGEEEGVHMITGPDGRATGEAFVELMTPDDVKQAMTKNKCHIGHRYIDVFKAKRAEMGWALKHSGVRDLMTEMEAIVRLRGLPYGCSKEEVANFFSGLEILPNGISILTDHFGRTTGDAFVQFASMDLVAEALLKHKQMIGHRYIEVFKSSLEELMSAVMKLQRQQVPLPQPSMGYGGGRGGRGAYGQMDRYGMGLGPMGGMGGGGPYDAVGYGGRGSGGRLGRGGFYSNGFDSYQSGYGGSDGPPMGYGSYGRLAYSGQPGAGGGFRGSRGGGTGGGSGSRAGGFGMGVGVGQGASRGGKRPFIGGIINRGSLYESQTGHSVHMRGLPYSAAEDDIAQFFQPLHCVNICLQYNKDGRPSGDADVDFASHEEAQEAMRRNKALMQKRYIELFLKSSPTPRSGNFRGDGFGNGCMYAPGPNYTAF